jgi:asparagine synthase (glutamine-hydrolysing)
MCGIAGVFDTQGTKAVSDIPLKPMIGALHHRGPDQRGLYLDDDVGLGHARLSIIDLAGGIQPIHNEERTAWIVLNGEIYNYRELRASLEARGHRFYTQTDTEVILHLYEEKGVDCVREFNGQFAFAVWDTIKRRLFLARDHFGICPLFYAESNGLFLFASEIKSLIASALLPPPALDPKALDQVFTFWTTLPGATAFENIRELEPGHTLTVDGQGRRLARYWDIPYHEADSYCQDSPGQFSERILALLMDATKLRLRADVPVGSYLSGGLDSSGITALIAGHFNSRVRTFGIRFQEADFDEGRFQSEMVAHLGVRHHELTAANDLIAETFPRVIWHCEKPVLRTAPIPMFLLSRFVNQQGIKVVCTGEGADEVFGGYDIFREALVRRFIKRRPESRFRPLLLDHLYAQIFKSPREKASFRGFMLRDPTDIGDPLFSHAVRWSNTARLKQLFSPALRAELGGYSALDDLLHRLPGDFARRDLLSKAQYLEDTIFLSNYLLSSQGDRMAMAHSVEIRPPYLDCRIADLMSRISPQWKILGLDEKHLLKKAFKGILPESILQRTKHPYRAPVQQAFAGLLGNDYWMDIFSGKTAGEIGLFDPLKVEDLYKKYAAGKSVSETEGMAIAGIASTHILFRQYVGGSGFAGLPSAEWDVVYDRRTAGAGRKNQSRTS